MSGCLSIYLHEPPARVRYTARGLSTWVEHACRSCAHFCGFNNEQNFPQIEMKRQHIRVLSYRKEAK